MKAIVTAGPTLEPIDPVRFLSNRSSGKQGYAIAEALRDQGFDVVLISGPVALNDPKGLQTVRIETAQEMLDISEQTCFLHAFCRTDLKAKLRVVRVSDDEQYKTREGRRHAHCIDRRSHRHRGRNRSAAESARG